MYCMRDFLKNKTLGNLYLHGHNLFHRIPVYSDSDKSPIHIQESSRHRSCKDRFHKETENKVNIWILIGSRPKWSEFGKTDDC